VQTDRLPLIRKKDNPEHFYLIALLFLCAVVFFYGLGRLPFIGPDEPRYAEVRRERGERVIGDLRFRGGEPGRSTLLWQRWRSNLVPAHFRSGVIVLRPLIGLAGKLARVGSKIRDGFTLADVIQRPFRHNVLREGWSLCSRRQIILGSSCSDTR